MSERSGLTTVTQTRLEHHYLPPNLCYESYDGRYRTSVSRLTELIGKLKGKRVSI